MPWCPNCKTEYREGMTVCTDCGTELVDELPEEKETKVVAFISEEELADKFIEYLGYEKIEATKAFNEQEDSFAISVEEDKLQAAKVAFAAFAKVESVNELKEKIEEAEAKAREAKAASREGIEIDEEMLESIPDEELSEQEKQALRSAIMSEQVYRPAEVYVRKADESKEMFSTAITFLVFAALLFVFLVLNAIGIIPLFEGNIPSLILLGAMAVACCLVGINAIKRSRKAEVASVEEDKLTAQLSNWLDSNINDETFASLDSEELSEEVLYLKRCEIIREKFIGQFGDSMDENYVDSLIEDFYNRRYEDAASEGPEEAEDLEAAEETEE